MGLAKSLRKIGYLSDLENSLKQIAGILDEQKKREDRENFFKVATELYNKYQEKMNEADMPYSLREGQSIEFPKYFSDEVGNFYGRETPRGLGLDVNIPEEIKAKLLPSIPNIKTIPISPQDRYKKSKENLYEFINAVAPLMLNQNLDEGTLARANILSNLAQAQTEARKPKEPTYFELAEGQERYRQDPITGEIQRIAINPKEKTGRDKEEYERDSKGNIITYNIGGQKYYRKLTKNAIGEIVNEELTRIPSKDEGRISIGSKDKEKGLNPAVADLIADLKNLKPYRINEEGDRIPLDPKDIKFAKDQTYERLKLELLRNPRAYEFISNIERIWKDNDPTGSREYLSPQELYNETVKHAQLGNIDEDVQEQIATFLQYYTDDIYEGLITKP